MKHDCIFTIRLLMLRPIMTQTNYPSSPFPPPPIHQSKNRKQHIAYLFCSDLSTRNSFTPPLSPHISRSTSSLLVSLTATTLTEAALMHLPPLILIHPLTPKKKSVPQSSAYTIGTLGSHTQHLLDILTPSIATSFLILTSSEIRDFVP